MPRRKPPSRRRGRSCWTNSRSTAPAGIIADRIDSVDDLLAGGATLEELASETEMQLGQIDWTATTNQDIAAYDAFRDAASTAAEGDFPEVDRTG